MNAADTSTNRLRGPNCTELPEGIEKDLSTFVNELFPQLFQLSDDLEKLLSSYCFNQQAIHALLSDGQQISEKELGGLIATEEWLNEKANVTQKELDNIISWILKSRPLSNPQTID